LEKLTKRQGKHSKFIFQELYITLNQNLKINAKIPKGEFCCTLWFYKDVFEHRSSKWLVCVPVVDFF